MDRKHLLASTAAAIAVLASVPANAANIVLTNVGGVVQGTAVYDAFQTAARFWGTEISNNISVNLNVGFQDLHSTSILGETNTVSQVYSLSQVDAGLKAVGTSAIDAVADAHLPGATTGTTAVETSGYINTAAKTGVNTSTQVLDNDGSANNSSLVLTNANAKALGLLANNPSVADSSIVFNSAFNYSFVGAPGTGQIDFLGVAIHEIGHALGFDSGVDILDEIGSPNGPALNAMCNNNTLCSQINTNNFSYATVLDLFRYSNLGVGGSPILTWAPGVSSYFSVDGGASSLCNFSSGAFNFGSTPANQHNQASHWADNSSCGIMDPTLARAEQARITTTDFAAFDAIGYNFTNPGNFTTGMIQAALGVPEPADWALMIVGLGLTGVVLRRRRAGVAPLRVGA